MFACVPALRLDVHMLSMEEFFRPLNSQVLDYIHVFAAAVVAFSGISLGVFAG